MYPLLLKPALKDYLWGGERLKKEFNYESEKDIVAEGWVLSCHKDGNSIVTNGKMQERTLKEVLDIWGEQAIGKRAQRFPYFPLLIKLIDARDKLSIQVHPDDEYALKNEGEYGKTEMWYVVDCEEDAELIYGFKENISKEEFERRIKDNTLTEVCNFVPVSKGDVFFIGAGTLHAIGKGILIAEVQQNSNTTYRVSDYGRLGADGKPRPLHIEKAVAVTKCEMPDCEYGQVGAVSNDGQSVKRELASCEFFASYILDLKDKTVILEKESFVSILCLCGNATLKWENDEIKICKGSSVFVPAGVGVELCGEAQLLCSYV